MRNELQAAELALSNTLLEQKALAQVAPKTVPRPPQGGGTGKAAEMARAYECMQPSTIGVRPASRPPKLDQLSNDDLKRVQMRGRRIAEQGARATEILQQRREAAAAATKKREAEADEGDGEDAKRLQVEPGERSGASPMVVEIADDDQEHPSVWVKSEVENFDGTVGDLREELPPQGATGSGEQASASKPTTTLG